MENNNVTYDLESVSPGVKYLTKGYMDYALEILVNRALPNVYDGLKTVNRRILYTMYKHKINKPTKSAKIAGDVLDIHPHSDDAVYGAYVLMTDKYGGLAFPLVEGDGAYGSVAKADPAAAKRYTEGKLHAWAQEYFGEMQGIQMIPSFDSSTEEPLILPSSFPALLINSTSGIAIGFKSNIPSFNFNDVCDLVIEYIKDGKCHTVIAPDFTTGGCYVKDDKELEKLMKTGKAKLKLRGKAQVIGNTIQISEVPYGKTVQGLVAQINAIENNCIKNAYDASDFEHGIGVTIECQQKKTDEALLRVLKNTDFQYSYPADITAVMNNEPVRLGVWAVIEEWVKWRKEVLLKEFTYRKEALEESIRASKAFMTIVNSDKKYDLVQLITKQGKSAGMKYIEDNFTREEVPSDLIDFCVSRSLPSYKDGGKQAGIFNNGQAQLDTLVSNINDIDTFIVNQMLELKRTYGTKLVRKTEVTTKDYSFDSIEQADNIKVIDTSDCGFAIKNGFIRKERFAMKDDTADFYFSGKSNDTLIAFDTKGRILRIYAEDLPYSAATDFGTHIGTYCNIDEAPITYIGRLTGETLMLLYRDGNVGFVDTSEWIDNNRKIRVIERGIATACADKLGYVFAEAEIPEVLVVGDNLGRLAWTITGQIKRKARTAKTRVFSKVKTDIKYMYKTSLLDLYDKLAKPDFFLDQFCAVKEDDWRGDFSLLEEF